MRRSQRSRRRPETDAEAVLGTEDASLLDIVDNVLNKGVVLSGDLTIALANVDLIYARVSLLLCAADRVLPIDEKKAAKRKVVSVFRPRRRGPVATEPEA
jgi:hypothetical protein